MMGELNLVFCFVMNREKKLNGTQPIDGDNKSRLTNFLLWEYVSATNKKKFFSNNVIGLHTRTWLLLY